MGCVEYNSRSHSSGGKPLFNSIALLEQGKIQQIFHKRLLPTYDVFDEHRYFEPGLQANSFTLEGIRSREQETGGRFKLASKNWCHYLRRLVERRGLLGKAQLCS
jgi:hypothetical protein